MAAEPFVTWSQLIASAETSFTWEAVNKLGRAVHESRTHLHGYVTQATFCDVWKVADASVRRVMLEQSARLGFAFKLCPGQKVVHVKLTTVANDGGEYGRYQLTVTVDGEHEGGIAFSAKSRAAAARYAKDIGGEVARGYPGATVEVHSDFPRP